MEKRIAKENQRDQSLDCIKFIGLIGLFASHIYTNNVILQLRSFDVNLLVILSAYLAEKSFEKQPILNLKDYVFYVEKRFCRLILPTWIFITIYIILNYCFEFQAITPVQIIRSYLLLNNSVGYVWIIYVYLICAITNPLISRIDLNRSSFRVLLTVLIVLYIVLVNEVQNYYLQLLILYPIIYSLISTVGFCLDKVNNFHWRNFSLVFIVAWAILAIYYYNIRGKFVLTGEFKYPPRLYYLTYSVGISVFLFLIRKYINRIFEIVRINRFVSFVCQHSLWFYLWHILGLQLSTRIDANQTIQFICLLSFCFVVIYIQNALVAYMLIQHPNSKVLKLFRG